MDETNRRKAANGQRVLAVAAGHLDGESNIDNWASQAEDELVFLGIIALADPVRSEAKEAIRACHEAGIRAVMITGDHVATATAVAEQLNLLGDGRTVVSGVDLDRMSDEQLATLVESIGVYGRVVPEHNLRIAKAWQSRRAITAMTGDGVNDAPALKQCDIGVAMGITGTDVAKESADIVLADDNFATIVAAVEEGRIVYDNIRKFVAYLLTTNAGEVLTLLLAILLGFPVPLLPVHILWINLVTDGLPALALAFEAGERGLMQRPLRSRDDDVVDRGWPSGSSGPANLWRCPASAFSGPICPRLRRRRTHKSLASPMHGQWSSSSFR